MAYISGISRYPYHGVFYKETSDMAKPLTEREIVRTDVFETECDVQETSKAANPMLFATFSVFFPFDAGKSVPVVRGMGFEASVCGQTVKGEVLNVVPSALNGVVAYVKDYEAE